MEVFVRVGEGVPLCYSRPNPILGQNMLLSIAVFQPSIFQTYRFFKPISALLGGLKYQDFTVCLQNNTLIVSVKTIPNFRPKCLNPGSIFTKTAHNISLWLPNIIILFSSCGVYFSPLGALPREINKHKSLKSSCSPL